MAFVARLDSSPEGEAAEQPRQVSPWELVDHAAILVALTLWAIPLTRAAGGRGVHNELIYSIVLIAVLLALRAWRTGATAVLLAAATSLAALLVCVFAPTHWYGSDVADGYALAAAAFLAVRRYVRDEDRRKLVAAAVCLACLYQFAQAFQPWWGGRDSSVEMSGTFYWHNPYAAFLLPGAVVGLGLILESRRPWSTVGWVSVPLCTAGIVFSSSRATMGALLVAVLLAVATVVRRRLAALRFGAALLLTAGVVALMPGPPLFPSYHAPWDSTTLRSGSGETLSQNGEYRTEFWRSAIEDAKHHPWVGTGYHALASDSVFYTPAGWARSPLAHDGYLQAISDGGLLLGLPFLLAVAVVGSLALKRLWASFRQRAPGGSAVEPTIALAVLAGMAHSAVDFDWTHPSILIEAAILAACLRSPGRSGARTTSWRSGLALGVVIGVLATLVPALHQWQIDQPSVSESTADLLAKGAATFGDYRPAKTVLRQIAEGERPVSTAETREALAQTADAAEVDLNLALMRDAVGAKAGLLPDAVDNAVRLLARIDGPIAPYVPELFDVEVSAGQLKRAQQLLQSDIDRQVSQGAADPVLSVDLALWAQDLGTGPAYACALNAARSILDPAAPRPPPPTAPCAHNHQGGR